MRNYFFFVLGVFVAGGLFVIERASAEPDLDSAQVSAALARPCDALTQVPSKVTTSTSTAATSAAIAKGTMRVWCSAKAHAFQGALGVTGPTAGTHHTTIGAESPEYFRSKGGKVAFILDTGSGYCEVNACQ